MLNFKIIIFNLVYATSQFPFGLWYRSYILQKRLSHALFGTPIDNIVPVLRRFDYALCIDGFFHSGNSFIESNIAEGRARVLTHCHRAWAIRLSVRHNVPILVLIRQPQDVALSLYYRRMADARVYGVNLIYPITVLFMWYCYHRTVLRYRKHLTIIPFPVLTEDYNRVVRIVARHDGIRLQPRPRYNGMNRFDGERPEVRFSWPSRFLLRRCAVLYDTLVQSTSA